MADNFDVAIKVLIQDEGEGVIPDDHGRGASKYGITLKTAQESHPDWTDEDIISLTEERAIEFYRIAFWLKYHFDRIAHTDLASKVFNFGVNVGPATSIRLLQRTVGGLKIDGILGPATAEKVNTSDAAQVLVDFKKGAAEYHKQVAANNPELATNLEGWLRRDEA